MRRAICEYSVVDLTCLLLRLTPTRSPFIYRWVGHGDGVHVYNPWSRQLIGKILIPGGKGVANFCWGGRAGSHPRSDQPMYRVLMFAEDELWEACIAVNGRD